MIGSSIRALAVVIPVHNEEQLLSRCLQSVEVAVSRVRVPVAVYVVIDASTDGSASVARRHPFPVVEIAAGSVGVARSVGVTAALRGLAPAADRRVWIANTDADSVVPSNWLTLQLGLAREGADMVIGTVRPDFADLTPQHRQLWLDTHTPGRPNGHVHGANLGVRADVYRAAGGFSDVPEHEDVMLAERCRTAGAHVVASDLAEVLTSGRLVGRTPGGYAAYLRDQHRGLGAVTPEPV